MKYAICILAHSNPELLSRIVNKVRSDNTEIFIHLDKKCNINEFKKIKDVVFIDQRVSISWGGSSMVVAMHNLIKHVIQNTSCNYLIFISGQDYPIISPLLYDKFIDKEKNYVEYEQLPKKDWVEGGFDRIRYYYLFDDVEGIYSRALLKIQRILYIERKNFLNEKIYGGSQWININRSAAEYIVNNWKRYFKFFRYTRIPDESIFQTILLNSEFKSSIINHNLRYLVLKNTHHPKYLDENNIESIKNENALFCRKIKDEFVFDRIDEHIKQEFEV